MVKNIIFVFLLLGVSMNAQPNYKSLYNDVIDGSITYKDKLFLPSSIIQVLSKMKPIINVRDNNIEESLSLPCIDEIKKNTNINALENVDRVRFHRFWKEGMANDEGEWIDFLELSYSKKEVCNKYYEILRKNQSNFFKSSFFHESTIMIEGEDNNIYIVVFPYRLENSIVVKQLLNVMIETIKFDKISIQQIH